MFSKQFKTEMYWFGLSLTTVLAISFFIPIPLKDFTFSELNVTVMDIDFHWWTYEPFKISLLGIAILGTIVMSFRMYKAGFENKSLCFHGIFFFSFLILTLGWSLPIFQGSDVFIGSYIYDYQSLNIFYHPVDASETKALSQVSGIIKIAQLMVVIPIMIVAIKTGQKMDNTRLSFISVS